MPAVSEINPAGLPEVVCFKRDLRVEDHTALAHATAAGPVLCVYAVELDYWRQPGTSDRQWQFVRECLLSLDAQLKSLGSALEIHVASVIQMLDALHLRLGSIIMGKEDLLRAHQAAPKAMVIGTHMEAVNHGMQTRKELRDFIAEKGMDAQRVRVPADGEIYRF